MRNSLRGANYFSTEKGVGNQFWNFVTDSSRGENAWLADKGSEKFQQLLEKYSDQISGV